jgi:hypothetical protein
MALEHLPYSLNLLLYDFPVSVTKNVLKGQCFASAKEVTAQTRALAQVSKNGFQKCFQKLYER